MIAQWKDICSEGLGFNTESGNAFFILSCTNLHEIYTEIKGKTWEVHEKCS